MGKPLCLIDCRISLLAVHKNEEHVFCPYCLKLVTFSYRGEPITTNVFFYISHLEKHQRLTLVKDCNRCQLSFIHKGILDQHMEADHGSWKNETGVIPIEHLPTGIFMPEPGGIIKPCPVVKPFKCLKTKNMFTMNKFKSFEMYGVDDNMACAECEGSLTFSEHFMGNFSCLKCRYASCCEKAIVEHFAIFHESSHPQFTKGKPIVLPQEMFCACGFSTSSGNRIAKHLAVCERESAYNSKEAALAAVLSKGDSDFEEKSKQGDGQNVLNMLGLVRKSPEAAYGGSSNESVKMEVEDVENLGIENEVKQEATLEIRETSQEESDTSDSQQDNSVIANTVGSSKTLKNQNNERETEGQVGEKIQVEVEAESSSISCGEVNFNFKNLSEMTLDMIQDENKTESAESSKKETERIEQDEGMNIDKNEPEEEKINEQMPDIQSKELSKELERTEGTDEATKIEDTKRSEQSNDTSEGGCLKEEIEKNVDEDVLNVTTESNRDAIETCDIITTEQNEAIAENTNSILNIESIACLEANSDVEKNISEAMDDGIEGVEKSI